MRYFKIYATKICKIYILKFGHNNKKIRQLRKINLFLYTFQNQICILNTNKILANDK